MYLTLLQLYTNLQDHILSTARKEKEIYTSILHYGLYIYICACEGGVILLAESCTRRQVDKTSKIKFIFQNSSRII